MKTRLILKPGQRGTKQLAKKYGEDLVCVRFRYDAKLKQRIKTIELVVERIDWTPPKPKYNADTLVPLRINPSTPRPKGRGMTSASSVESLRVDTERRF